MMGTLSFTCYRCDATKPLDDFYKKNNNRGHTTMCRACTNASKSDWYKKNPEARREASRRYDQANKDKKKEYHRKKVLRAYGLTPESYEALLAEQDYRCALCNTHTDEAGTLAVDHDHSCCPEKSKSCGDCVRGLLCGKCNMALGLLGDNTDLMAKAIDYVKGGGHGAIG